LFAHTILSLAPYQISRFDQAIRVGSSGLSNNFYFAYTKKGGALGNFPVQIAKIHETILNQIANSDQNQSHRQVPGSQHEGGDGSSSYQGGFHQYKNLSNTALRNLSRMIKLDLLQYPLLSSRPCMAEQDRQMAEFLQDQRLFETIFNVSYMQSLIHLQQYTTDSASVLFISSRDLLRSRGEGS